MMMDTLLPETCREK